MHGFNVVLYEGENVSPSSRIDMGVQAERVKTWYCYTRSQAEMLANELMFSRTGVVQIE